MSNAEEANVDESAATHCYPPLCEDDIPVTAEWIWRHITSYRASKRSSRHAVNTVEFRYAIDGGFCSLESDLGYGSDIEIRTRGDVRKLCEVLGIRYELKSDGYVDS